MPRAMLALSHVARGNVMKYTNRHFELAETARREARKWQDKKDNDETFDDLPAPGIDKGYLAEETHKLVLASILRDSTKDVIITIPAWDQMAPPDEPFPDVLTAGWGVPR